MKGGNSWIITAWLQARIKGEVTQVLNLLSYVSQLSSTIQNTDMKKKIEFSCSNGRNWENKISGFPFFTKLKPQSKLNPVTGWSPVSTSFRFVYSFGNSAIWIPCQGCVVSKNLKFEFDFPTKIIVQINFRFRLIQKSRSLPFSWRFSLFNFENQTKLNWVRGKIVGLGVEILNHVLTKFENVPADLLL